MTARGNAGERIYWDDNDRRYFLELVCALPERYGAQVHANRRLRHTVNKAMRHLQNNEI